MAVSSPDLEALKAAIREYENETLLTTGQKKAASLKSAQEFLDSLSPDLLRLKEMDKSRVREALARLRPLTDTLTILSPAIDSFANADSHGIVPLVWGSIRIVLIIAKDYFDFWNQVGDAFSSISVELERLRFYANLFSQNRHLQNSLSRVFCDIMNMCRFLRTFFNSKSGKRFLKHVFGTKLKEDLQYHITKIIQDCNIAHKDAERAHYEAQTKAHAVTHELVNVNTERVLDNLRSRVSSKVLKKLSKWLKPIPVGNILDQKQRDRLEGTCAWVLQHQEICEWLSARETTNPGLLWITAQPGYGKSYIASYLIGRRQEIIYERSGHTIDLSKGCAYFFCSASGQSSVSAADVLRTLSWQLLQYDPTIERQMESYMDSEAHLDLPTVRKLLYQLIGPRCWLNIVIDGLDECPQSERKELLTDLIYLASRCNILLISRYDADCKTSFATTGVRSFRQHIDLNPDWNHGDIKFYTTTLIKDIGMSISFEAQTQISRSICNKSNGMFLWIRLILDELRLTHEYSTHCTLEAFLQVVTDFPEALDGVYSLAVQRIKELQSPRIQNDLRLIVTWIVLAARPLTTAELEAAVAHHLKMTKMKTRIPNVMLLMHDYCRAFVEFDSTTRSFKIIHATVTSFLFESERAEAFSINHSIDNWRLAGTCLSYLETCFSQDKSFWMDSEDWCHDVVLDQPTLTFRKIYSTLALLEYSIIQWPIHLNALNGHARLFESIATFLQNSANTSPSHSGDICYHQIHDFCTSVPLILRWIRSLYLLQLEDDKKERCMRTVAILDEWNDQLRLFKQASLRDPLLCGLINLLEHIGRTPSGRIHRLRRFMTLYWRDLPRDLHILAFFDYVDELDRHVNAANVNSTSGILSRSALQYAAYAESLASMERLLDAGANINYVSYCDGRNALELSCQWRSGDGVGSYSATSLLSSKGAETRSSCSGASHNFLTLLCETPNALEFRISAIKELLHNATDQDLEFSGTDFGWTPLHAAAQRNSMELADLLLRQHSCPAAYTLFRTRDTGKTALHVACEHVNSEVAAVLLPHAKAELADYSVLHVAAASRSSALDLLLKAGMNANLTDSSGRSALHIAASERWTEGVRLIIKHGGDMRIRDHEGRLALDYLKMSGQNHDETGDTASLSLMLTQVEEDTTAGTENLLQLKQMSLDDTRSEGQTYQPNVEDIEKIGHFVRHLLLERATPASLQRRHHLSFSARQALAPYLSVNTLSGIILDLANYNFRNLRSTNKSARVNCKQAQDQNYVYLEGPTMPASPSIALRRLYIETLSHDQGWSDYRQDHGTYNGSMTGFSLGLRRAQTGGAFEVERGPHIASNVHADTLARKHAIWISPTGKVETNTETARGSDEELSKWAKMLRSGDQILVLVDAKYPGWVNFVLCATIEITLGFMG